MKIFRTILGFGLLASSFVGQTTSSVGDAGGAVLNYGGIAIKNVGRLCPCGKSMGRRKIC